MSEEQKKGKQSRNATPQTNATSQTNATPQTNATSQTNATPQTNVNQKSLEFAKNVLEILDCKNGLVSQQTNATQQEKQLMPNPLMRLIELGIENGIVSIGDYDIENEDTKRMRKIRRLLARTLNIVVIQTYGKDAKTIAFEDIAEAIISYLLCLEMPDYDSIINTLQTFNIGFDTAFSIASPESKNKAIKEAVDYMPKFLREGE